MLKPTAALAALALFTVAACATALRGHSGEIPNDAPTAPVISTPQPVEAAPAAAPAPAPAPEPKTEADKCVAKCLAERKAAGDEQASEFWCVQDCNGGNDW